MGFVVLAGLAIITGAGCGMSAQGRNVDGVRNYELGRYHNAIQHFQRALASDPNNADSYYNLAATYTTLAKQNGDRALMQQAEGLYHQCLDLNPDHVSCYRGLASLLIDTDRQESAFTLMRRWAQRSYGPLNLASSWLVCTRNSVTKIRQSSTSPMRCTWTRITLEPGRRWEDCVKIRANSLRRWPIINRLIISISSSPASALALPHCNVAWRAERLWAMARRW